MLGGGPIWVGSLELYLYVDQDGGYYGQIDKDASSGDWRAFDLTSAWCTVGSPPRIGGLYKQLTDAQVAVERKFCLVVGEKVVSKVSGL